MSGNHANPGKTAWRILAVNTFAFAACFAAWMLNGPLVTFFADRGLFDWSRSQIGVLIAVPVLTGSLMRLPVGVLCDRFGGRVVFCALMLVSAAPMYLVSHANRYMDFVLAGLGFGVAGAAFAAGVAYTSVWFGKDRVGTALGIFGMGNVGAAATSMFAPLLLRQLTATDLEGWRTLPKLYAGLLVATAVLFWLTTEDRRAAPAAGGLAARLTPLRHLRVWRFGMYYAFFFGGFIALSQWLIPYYVNVYTLSIVVAGPLAAIYSLSSSGFRALGGWLSDKIGARRVVYWSLATSMVFSLLLFPAAMVIHTPGQGVVAGADATVTRVSATEIELSNGARLPLNEKDPARLLDFTVDRHLILPTTAQWQEPVVAEGQAVKKGELLAQGTTRVFFQANRWVFTTFVFLLAIAMGFGMAGVYTLIPAYFPREIGVVGGLVGVLGGLGGFVLPIVFGLLLDATGLWTTCWVLLFLFGAACLIWMHVVVHKMPTTLEPGPTPPAGDSA
ncbi:MFS transporter [Paludisphaera sp.]|uniref:MFS transporter n=1 Tax=Paludisphaera sp. TaxID=2017432 RepID=UPI00301CE278